MIVIVHCIILCYAYYTDSGLATEEEGKFTGHDIQNEILKLMALSVL